MAGPRDTERAGGPDPARVTDTEGLVRELELLRRRAAYGTSKARVGLADLARLSGVPRSTVHTYVNGMRLPPADVLDRIVVALGADAAEQAQWAEALERLELGTPSGDPADGATATVPRQLPAAPSVFVGRADSLAALDALGPDRRRLGVLTGGGGMGKSTLAMHWGRRVADRFPDGQLYLDLQGFGPRPPRSPDDALAVLLRGVGVEPHEIPATPEARGDLFSEQTTGRRLLVLLDNARDAAQVLPLVSTSQSVTTLVTSRDDLAELVIVHDAVPVPIGPLDSGEVDELIELAVRDARAGDQRDAAWLTQAMRRCSGMPLALRIIGERWLRGLSTSAAPGSPEELLDEMGLGSSDLGVRTTLGWTLDQLPPDVRQVFRRLGAIPQAVADEDLVAAVAESSLRDTRRALETLAGVHLVTPTHIGFTMHDLVAAFAHERYLTEEPPDVRRDVEDRLAQHVGAVAQRVCLQFQWESPVAEDLGATDFADLDAARQWLEQHLDTLVAVATDDAVTPRYQWLAAAALGRRHQFFDPSSEVEDALVRAAVSARRSGNHRALGMLENLLGVACAIRGDHGAAWRHMSVALRRYRRDDWDYGVQAALSNLAKLATRLGHHDEAIASFEELIAGDHGAEDHLRLSLAELSFDLHDLDAVHEHATWVIEHQPTPMAHSVVPTAYHFLAQIQARTGHPARARAALEKAPLGPEPEALHLVDRLCVESDIASAEGHLDEAAALGRRALRGAQASENSHLVCYCLMNLADIELGRDDEAAAAVWLTEARLIAEPVGLHHWTMLAMLRSARLSHRLGDPGAARAELDELVHLADTCGSTPMRDQAGRLAGELAVDAD